MITTLFFLCLALLDFRQTSKPDGPFANFVVHAAADPSAMSGCTISPSQGRSANVMIAVDWIDHHEPDDVETSTTWIASHSLGDEIASAPTVVPYQPPGLPDPDSTPPVSAVPEPPTVAILCVSGIVLLYTIFGGKRRRRYR